MLMFISFMSILLYIFKYVHIVISVKVDFVSIINF